MFKNHIKEAEILNAVIIEDETGKKIYYDKVANYVSLTKLLHKTATSITLIEFNRYA